MTWHYRISADGSSIDIWDHTAATGDAPMTTVQLDQPRSKSDEQVVLDVMANEIKAALANGGIQRAIQIGRDAACEQIVRGAP